MSTLLAESNWPACHSALALDRLAHGELAEAEAQELSAHLAGCARCQAAAEGLRLAAEEPLPPLREMVGTPNIGTPTISPRPNLTLVRGEPQPAPLAREEAPLAPPAPARPAPRRWARLATVATGLAAAAALLLAIRPGASPAERSKGSAGGFSLGMYVQHGPEVRRAGPGEQVRPGDAVRFAVSAPESGYAAVLSLDPAGRASIYFPLEGRAAAVPAGADVPLPLSTRLDETVGSESLLGLFCTGPVELAPVRASLEQGRAQIPDGCQVARWSFVKH